MNKDTARNFLEALAWSEAPFGKMDLLLQELDSEEKEKYRKILGDIVGCHSEFIIQIVNQYPELDPEGKGKAAYQNFKEKYEPKNT